MYSLFLPRRNPLAYPCGVAPGVDPMHPMSDRIRFSGFVSGGNFVDLLSGRVGTITGTLTPRIDASIGPALAFPSSLNRTEFGGSTNNDTSITMAAIVRFLTYNDGTANSIIGTSSSNAGWRLAKAGAGAGTFRLTAGSVADVGTQIALPSTNPYFIVASANASSSSMVLLDLLVGALFTATSTGANSIAPNGTIRVGSSFAANEQMRYPVSHVMFAARYHSLPELIAWASDPWSFWYPQRAQRSYMVPGSSTPPPATAYGGPWLVLARRRFRR